MRAERDIAIPPRGDGNPSRRGKAAGGFKLGRKPARRGEKEASNLLWRRRIKMVQRVFTLFLLLGAGAICFEAWRGGALLSVADRLGPGLQKMEVKAGLTVDEVRIKGQNRTPLAQIRAALDLQPHQPILAVNLDEARLRIEQLAWVKQASVSRQLPSAIDINITERKPFALWQEDGHMWLIDAEGARLTDRKLDEFTGLPQVVGTGAPEKAAALVALLKTQPDLFARVRAAVLVSNRRWDLVMKNGVRVRLPDENEEAAYARLAGFQKDQQILERNVAVIDLRFTDRLVVALDDDTASGGLKASNGTDKAKESEVRNNRAPASGVTARHRGREI